MTSTFSLLRMLEGSACLNRQSMVAVFLGTEFRSWEYFSAEPNLKLALHKLRTLKIDLFAWRVYVRGVALPIKALNLGRW